MSKSNFMCMYNASNIFTKDPSHYDHPPSTINELSQKQNHDTYAYDIVIYKDLIHRISKHSINSAILGIARDLSDIHIDQIVMGRRLGTSISETAQSVSNSHPVVVSTY